MKHILLLTAMIITMAVQVQAQLGIGVELGFNASDYNIKKNNELKQTDMKFGGRLGGFVDYAFANHFYFQPGIYHVTNGYKSNLQNGYEQYTISTVEIPLNVVYKTGLFENSTFFIGAGPFLGYNRDGEYYIQNGSILSKKDLDFGKWPIDDIRKLDLGGGANIGYQNHTGFFLRARAQMGLLNLVPGKNRTTSMESVGYCLSVGYIFYTKNKMGKTKMRKGYKPIIRSKDRIKVEDDRPENRVQ